MKRGNDGNGHARVMVDNVRIAWVKERDVDNDTPQGVGTVNLELTAGIYMNIDPKSNSIGRVLRGWVP